MRKHDVGKYGSRAQTVYANLALRLIKEQLSARCADGATALDVVSLIEMRDTASIFFQAEPLCPHLLDGKHTNLCAHMH